jgi:hypothetical protein
MSPLCWVCHERPSKTVHECSMCTVCGKDYDRRAHETGTIYEAMHWAAVRARRFEAKRARAATRRT